MKNVKKINQVFLLTVVTALVGGQLYYYIVPKNVDYSISLLYSQLILILPTLFYVLKNRLSLKDLLRVHKIKVGTIFWLILFAYLIMPLMQEINLISMLFSENVITDKMNGIMDGKPFVFSLFLIAGVPAMLEESVYRGCFFSTYSKQSPLKAVIFSALLFGLMHLNFNQFCYAFVMGGVFCMVIEATDSIISSMILHFIINGSSVVMLYLRSYIQKFYENVYSAQNSAEVFQDVNSIPQKTLLIGIVIYGMVAVVFTALAGLVFFALAKHQGRWEHIKNMFRKKDVNHGTNKGKIVTGSLIAGIIICFAVMIMSEI